MKKMKLNAIQLVGLLLFLAGMVVVVVGAYNLISFNTSTGGKIANKAAGFFGGSTDVVRNARVMIGIGAAGALAGFFIYKKK